MKEKIKKGDIFDLQKKLSEIPNIPEAEKIISKQEALKILITDIKKLQRKGYSYEQIANILEKQNFKISISYIKQSLSKKRKKKNNHEKQSVIENIPKRKAQTKLKKITNTLENIEQSSSSFKVKPDSDEI